MESTSLTAPRDPPWARSPAELAFDLGTDVERGLEPAEAARRLERDGPNELEAAPPVPLWRRFAQQFADPLVIMLLVAIVISTIAWWSDGGNGAPLESIVITAIVLLNAVIGTWQEARAIQAVAALNRLAAPHATVIRGGHPETITRDEVVVGDLLALAAGDAVAADCRIVSAASLQLGEAVLTGESQPVVKSPDPVGAGTPLAERLDMAFGSTVVTAGRGRAVVTATGMDTEIGKIADLIDQVDREPTPLQRQMDWLGRALGAVVLVLAAIVVTAIVVTAEQHSFGSLIDALLVGVSIAVAAVPEGLPAILTIVLALGVQRMAGHHAIVKRLASVETLGSASVICTDKTGTLTRNEMTIVAALTASGEVAGSDGRPLDDADWVDRVPGAVLREVEATITAGSIANDARIRRGDDGGWQMTGDPTEVAFLLAETGLRVAERRHGSFERMGEVPFHADRRLMSTVNHPHAAAGDWQAADGEFVLFTKGAPDVLLDRCVDVRLDGEIVPLDDERRARFRAGVESMAARSLRTLAVAYRPISSDLTDVGPELERDLVLLGVVGMIDPPRSEAFDAVRDAQRGGVRVIMMTGDHPLTAGHIAAGLGITDDPTSVALGSDVASMDEAQVRSIVAHTNVFARVEPEHKLRLVDALQANGHITAMTGDGVNDAPALRRADIGVAMGIGGTEVSKEAADMILADDNFATILRAIREGREIFADIRKFIRFLLTSNSGEVLVVLFGVLLAGPLGLVAGADGLAVPLLATQILWINLVTDGALALALGVDPPVDDVMAEPPRRPTDRVVDRTMLVAIALIGITTTVASLVALDLELAGGLLGGSGDLETARTMVFTTLVLSQVVNAFNARSDHASAFTALFSNRMLWVAALATVGAQVLVVHLPGLSDAFDTVALTLGQWAICVTLSSAVLAVAEAHKWAVRRTAHRARSRF